MKAMIITVLFALVATSLSTYLGYGGHDGLYGYGYPVGRAVAYGSSIRHPGYGYGLGYGGYGYGLRHGYGYGLGHGYGLGLGYGGYGLGHAYGGYGHGKLW